MQSKDVLKQAIKDFDGTAIIVSHDRDFLDGLVDKVYEFGGGKVREHLGGIYDFLQKKQIESLNELGRNMNSSGSPTGNVEASTATPVTKASEQNETSTTGSLSYAEMKERNKAIKKAETAVKNAEAKIEKLEAELADIEAKLATPEGASDTSLFTKHGDLKKQIDAAVEEWENASMELEEMKQ
jgi:ATP-binding cassette subfamily F protein 3